MSVNKISSALQVRTLEDIESLLIKKKYIMKKQNYMNKIKILMLTTIFSLFYVRSTTYGQSNLLCGDLDRSSEKKPEVRHNVSDIVILVNYILGIVDREENEYCPSLANVNKDENGDINVSDIVVLVNYILDVGEEPSSNCSSMCFCFNVSSIFEPHSKFVTFRCSLSQSTLVISS